MLRSKILNLAKVKYFFTLLHQSIFLVILAVDESVLCRIVTDLHLKKLSYNEIREHIQLIYHLDVTKHKIKVIIQKAGEKAKAINKRLNSQIHSKISVIEVDEVFQGKSHIILGVTEKFSQYLVSLRPAIDRTSTSISEFLSPIARRFCNVRVVITDLFTAYRTVIPNIFKKARHLACHIHVQRDSMRKIEKFHNRWKKTQRKRILTENMLCKQRKKIAQLEGQKRKWEKMLHMDKEKLHELKKQKRNSLTGRTKTVDRLLEVVKKRIKRRSILISTIKSDFTKARNKREELRLSVRQISRNCESFRQNYLQSSRLQSKFFQILKDKSSHFPKHLEKFNSMLENSKYDYGRHILKLIKENPHIFALRKSTDLAWNFQNSNTIERIFGILRPRLDSSRLLKTTEGAEAYCDLFRLYYNTTPRYTGIHNKMSPLEQLGGKIDKRNYLDLIFPTRKRTTVFIGGVQSKKLNLGFNLRSVKSEGSMICS
ncbi:MAG: transposase [Bacteroidales bacterium]|nr:transposase [Bacteroidales bacterium]